MKTTLSLDICEKKVRRLARPSLTAVAVASLFGMSSAIAEPLFQQSILPKPDNSRWVDNYVELGVGGVKTNAQNGKAFKFGEYNGLKNDDPFAIVGFNWIFQSQDNDAVYVRTHANNLGLDTRKFSIEGGKQGSYDLSFSAERLLRSEISGATFMQNGLGSNNLTNPRNGALTVGQADLKPFDVEQGRDIYRFGLRGILAANWDFKVAYREDQRDGTRTAGIPFRNGPAAVVPYAIDDKTQQIDATIGYTTKTLEGQLTYSYSRYENALDRMLVDNPANNSNPAPATSNTRNGQMSLMPDNEYHQVTATGAYNFSKDTRAKAQFSYGIATQNDSFLPYTRGGTNSAPIGGTVAAPIALSGYSALPTSLDAEVINTVADLALMTKPIEAMSLKIGYQYRDIDNQTPRIWVNYYGRDGEALPNANGTSNSERRNAPVSTTEQRVYLDTDYEIAQRTQLRGLIEHTQTDYTLSDVTETQTNKIALDLRRTFSDEFLGSVGYAFTQRTGSQYDKNTYFRETYTTTYQNNAANPLTNHPSMRPFMLNDYDENRVKALGNWTATETVTLGASVDAYDRNYKGNDCSRSTAFGLTATTFPDTCLGTQKSLGGNANIDLNWQPDENLLFFTFLTLGHSETNSSHRNWNSVSATDLSNTARDWTAKLVYTDQTVGFGTRWNLTSKWELGGQYVYTYGEGKSDIRALNETAAPATGKTSVALPNTESEISNVNLYAKWMMSSRFTVRFNYLYERMKSNDWAYDNVNAIFAATPYLLTGQQSPKYENHVVGVSVAISTW